MKIRLIETTVIGPEEYSKSSFLNESEQTVFVEKKGQPKVEYKAKAIYTFPISKPGKENLNGRIYSEKLWKNTEKRMKNSSTFGLMDHPEHEGSTKDIWCVWRNLRISEDRSSVVADAYLIGKWGEMVKEILDAGGKVGLSTSGFGEILEDKKTIDPDTYELERVADFVFNPSYEVYGSQENIINQEESIMEKTMLETLEEEQVLEEKKKKASEDELEDIKEPVENKDDEKDSDEKDKKKKTQAEENDSDDDDDDNDDDNDDDEEDEVKEKKKKKESEDKEDDEKKEPKKSDDDEEKKDKDDDEEKKDKEDEKKEKNDSKKESFLAKSFKMNMVSSFKQALKQENANERMSQLAELLFYFEEGIEDELKNEIQEALEKEKSLLIEATNAEQKSIKTDFEKIKKEKEAVEEKFNDSLELLDSLKVYSKKLKEMYDLVSAEKNGMVTATEYREAQIYLEGVEHENELLEREVIQLRSKLSERKQASSREDEVRPSIKIDEEKTSTVEKIDLNSVNPEVLNYYTNLEYSSPSVILIKEDILRCRTIMEAQKTSLRLKPIWEESHSAYDRKVVSGKSSYAESSKQKLDIKKGWM